MVESALDFFERAVEEHDSDPKYATLHLATSVELFLKARLMAEHWTLIISPKKQPTFANLKGGDFLSVTLSEAIQRLNGVLPPSEAVSKDASQEFDALAKERNKIAHFFHADLDGGTEPRSILQRQCRVWFHLHRLLASVWRDEFAGFETQLGALDRKMREEMKFLNAIFDGAKDDLDKHRSEGLPVASCPSCGFEAMMVYGEEGLTNGFCAVCRYQSSLLRVTCPECNEPAILTSGDDGCRCGHEFSPQELADILNLHRPGEMDHAPEYIYCPDCYNDDVFPIDGEYACLNCFQTFEDVGSCDWCSTTVAGGVPEFSGWSGCEFCDGHAGHIRDRDD